MDVNRMALGGEPAPPSFINDQLVTGGSFPMWGLRCRHLEIREPCHEERRELPEQNVESEGDGV